MLKNSVFLFFKSTSSIITNVSNINREDSSDLKIKLKEAYIINEEIKASFKKNLSQLQNTLRECVDDREKIVYKR